MDYKIEQYSFSAAGAPSGKDGRPVPHDCIYPVAGQGSDSDRVFVVADGMGADGLGAVASAAVCRAAGAAIGHAGSDALSVDHVQQAIVAAYDALDAEDRGPERSMGTTIAMLCLYSRGYITAHMGDSRVYHIRPGRTAAATRIVFRTADHTMAQHLVKTGAMQPSEAETSPKRHVLTRAMQPNMARRCRAEVHISDNVEAGDYFLLCTDGVHECLTDDLLRTIFSAEGGTAKNKVALLSKASASSVDSRSAIVVHVSEIINIGSRHKAPARPALPRDSQPAAPAPMAPAQSPATRTSANPTASIMDTNRPTSASAPAAAGNEQLPTFIKFILILMGVLVVIMCAYYLFIRTDETLQTAGTAVDPTVVTDEVETYGYEITEQDIRNEAQPVMVEEETVDEDVADDTAVEPGDTETAPEGEPSAAAAADEPILQE